MQMKAVELNVQDIVERKSHREIPDATRIDVDTLLSKTYSSYLNLMT